MNKIYTAYEMGTECISSERILEGQKVGYMYRQRPLEPNDSGWRFFVQEEMQDNIQKHTVRTDINNVIEVDKRVKDIMSSVWGSEYVNVDGEFVFKIRKKNYKRIINRITARIGRIDRVEKRENNFPVAVISSKGVAVSVSDSENIDERMIYIGSSDDYKISLLNAVVQSGAREGDIVVLEGSNGQAGGLLVVSDYGLWVTKIEVIDKSMLNFARENSVSELMAKLGRY